jgi:transcription elongation GreA/GreB family factor
MANHNHTGIPTMSRAFVKDDDQTGGAVQLSDRPISAGPNLVTPRGLREIERKVDEHRLELAEATAAGRPEAAARASRELRYWSARHATAQVVEPPAAVETVVFGVAITGRRENGSVLRLRIVGEDEADPTQGRIAWTAPVARALMGGEPGEVRDLPTGMVEIVAIDAEPEPVD